VPTEAHFSQMKKRIGKPGFKGIESYLRKEANRLRLQYPMLAAGLVQAVWVGLEHEFTGKNAKVCLRGLQLQPAWPNYK